MTGGIYLVHGDDLVPMTVQAYPSEGDLQDLVARHPELLAGDQAADGLPRRWLLITREMPVPGEPDGTGRWSLDHLFLDQEGVPTLVEVKRSSDTRIRREVVGQMLDYAANSVVHWPVEAIRARFEATCEAVSRDPAEALLGLIGPDEDPDAFWQLVKTNLQAGRIRMVFLADYVPPELQRIVEFLNGQMDPAEVLAIEVRQYVGPDQRAVAPRIVGMTGAAQTKKSTARSQSTSSDELTFFDELTSSLDPTAIAFVRRLQAWAVDRMPRASYKKRQAYALYSPCLDVVVGAKKHPYVPISVRTDGKIQVLFRWLRQRPGFEDGARCLELVRRLDDIEGVSIDQSAIGGFPTFPLPAVTSEAGTTRLLAALDWFVNEVHVIAGAATMS